ncbi:MAG: hypothetical protein SFY69_06285, partial [Planctomycetota bacterium]|nr:hypothetical protein [Planctomycetota bacterium]
ASGGAGETGGGGEAVGADEPRGAGLSALAPEAVGAGGAEGSDGAWSANPGDDTAEASAPIPAADDRVLTAAEKAWETKAPTIRAGGAGREVGGAALAARGPDAALLDLARRMSALLREPPETKIDDAAALAAIEALRAGVLRDLESPSNVLHAGLDERDRLALLEARARVAATPGEANASLTRRLAGIAPGPGMRIVRGLLCTRVQGFGRYEAFASTTFAAGSPIRAIVYTELDGFGSRPAREGDPAMKDVALAEQTSVELTQELGLYTEPGGLRAWHKPGQRVIETTRGRRRDFYLIHTIELPRTLSVGRYVLKATVTDVTTGASDEVNIPITVVAR